MKRVRRIFALLGSGETAPTMVGVHRRLADPPPDSAILLSTPYAFQENVDDISKKAQKYFADSVGLQVAVAPEDPERAAAGIRTAGWVFSGPGSPSYALSRWQGGPVERALLERLRRTDGVTVFASAAAATAGAVTVPVYEIYKVGAPPHWLPGLNITAAIGLNVAVIPHYDNAEGGTHDTRFCYLGERRLRAMEHALPDGCAVLGIDEHTGVVLDLEIGLVEVQGRGGLTVRRDGESSVLPSGTRTSLDELRGLLVGSRTAPSLPTGATVVSVAPADLMEITRDCERRFDEALRAGDASAMLAAVLDLESDIHAWSADTDEDQGTEQARDVLRDLIRRLGEAAVCGVRDPREVWAPIVEPLLALRETLRSRRRYEWSDAIRTALSQANVEIRDTETGPTWSITP